jgi:hypothetical protein
MALATIVPFTEGAYGQNPGVAAFCEWLIANVPAEGADWCAVVQRYRWSGYDLDLTLEARRRQGQKIAGAGDDMDKWRDACDHVTEWAGQDVFSDADVVNLRAGCLALAEEPNGLPGIFFRRAATTSKLYAALYPERWVIYDSRVALRLAAFVRQWWDEENGGVQTSSAFLRFPIPPGRAAIQPPDGFPGLGTDKQARLAFFYASWLCRQIAARLDADGEATPDDLPHWTAQLVEMALFAEPA